MADDPFDPGHLLDPCGGSGDALIDAWTRLVRDGQTTLQALIGLESSAETIRGIAALDEPQRRAALMMAVVRCRRADGMTNAQYREWLLRDFGTLDEQ